MSILEGWQKLPPAVAGGIRPCSSADRAPDYGSGLSEVRILSGPLTTMQVRILSGVRDFGEATRLATGAVLKTDWAKAVQVRLLSSPLMVRACSAH
jgi:hypothetical protein